MTLREYLRWWLKDLARHRVRGRTYQRYEQIIEDHLIPGIGSCELDELKPQDVQSYYSYALERGRLDRRGGLSPSTVHHHHRVLRCALKTAVRWGQIPVNPARLAQPPRPGGARVCVLDEEQQADLINAMRGGPCYLPVVIAIGTGMRRGEILALSWDAIDFDESLLRVVRTVEQTRGALHFREPKTQRGRRRIDLPAYLTKILERTRRSRRGHYDGDSDLVCLSPKGGLWWPDSFSAMFRRQLELHGLPHMRFHDLRHSHASELLRHGVHPKVVSERLGHATVSFTLDTYSHLLPSLQEEAASKLDEAMRGMLEGE